MPSLLLPVLCLCAALTSTTQPPHVLSLLFRSQRSDPMRALHNATYSAKFTSSTTDVKYTCSCLKQLPSCATSDCVAALVVAPPATYAVLAPAPHAALDEYIDLQYLYGLNSELNIIRQVGSAWATELLRSPQVPVTNQTLWYKFSPLHFA